MTKTTKQKPVVKSRGQGRFHIEFKNPAQKMAWSGFQQHDILFLCGPAGVGKAQPLDAIVITPFGEKPIGELKIGDLVINPIGISVPVVGVHPQGMKPTYRITFKDGVSTECCEDHLWQISSNSRGFKDKIKSTKWIADNFRCGKNNRRHLTIPVTNAVEFAESEKLDIPAYLMGVLLGDGGFSGGSLVLTNADEELIYNCSKLLNNGYCLHKNKNSLYGFYITNNIGSKNQLKNNYILELEKNGLWGLRSHEKFIPETYLLSSISDRRNLLKGLMDTDGTVRKNSGQAEYVTTSSKLAKNFVFLCESLGYVCKITEKIKKFKYKGKIREGKLAFCIGIACNNPEELFGISRKKQLCKKRTVYFVNRIIDDVKYIGNKKAVCITVGHENGLYLTNNFIVTHNSYLAIAFAINEVLQGNKKKIILTRPIVESGERLGFLPGDLHEKVNPYMMPLYDSIDKLVGKDNTQRDIINASIDVSPLAYLRGRTFDDAICIFDEAQNASLMQLKLFMTRLGENSKMVITGDPSQSDLGGSYVALTDVIHKLDNVPGIGILKFKSDSIVRHPLVAAIVDKLGESP